MFNFKIPWTLIASHHRKTKECFSFKWTDTSGLQQLNLLITTRNSQVLLGRIEQGHYHDCYPGFLALHGDAVVHVGLPRSGFGKRSGRRLQCEFIHQHSAVLMDKVQSLVQSDMSGTLKMETTLLQREFWDWRDGTKFWRSWDSFVAKRQTNVGNLDKNTQTEVPDLTVRCSLSMWIYSWASEHFAFTKLVRHMWTFPTQFIPGFQSVTTELTVSSLLAAERGQGCLLRCWSRRGP